MAKKKHNKFSQEWIKQTREMFREFLNATQFPNPACLGERGSELKYPEWLIMFIAILAVKCKGVVKAIFDLDRCWMRGNANIRWLFAAGGLAVQMHQRHVLNNKISTWQIKSEVLGEP